MKWTRSFLLTKESTYFPFEEEMEISREAFSRTTLLNGVKNVFVKGNGLLDAETDRFYVDMTITGVILCPDAVTGEEIEYPFETSATETYAFTAVDDEEEEARVVTDDVIDLEPAVIDAILMEAPLQLTNAAPEDYPEGDGWRVITEEDYQRSKEEEIDPRLAALKQFKQDKQ